MNRRAFLNSALNTSLSVSAAAAALPVALQAQTAKTRTGIYVMQHYELQLGPQSTRFTDYLSKSYIPALTKVHSGPVLVLEAQEAQNLPLTTIVTGYRDVAQMWEAQAKLAADKTLEAATDAWQAAGDGPYEKQYSDLLDACDFSPEIVAMNPQPATPRFFEMRIYQTRTAKQLRGLTQRFVDGEARILAKDGGKPVLFGQTAVGQDTPNLTWMMVFPDRDAREKFNNAFAADPEWAKLRQESLDKNGQVPQFRRLTLYRAAAYSPVR